MERKHTRFETCERHRWLEDQTRARRAEFFAEGGPANAAGCRGGTCRLWPGRDLFIAELCHDEMELDWTREPELERADVEYADEEESGQLALGVPGEQRALVGLAKEGKPAPVAPDTAGAVELEADGDARCSCGGTFYFERDSCDCVCGSCGAVMADD